jgi:hypothetical protein
MIYAKFTALAYRQSAILDYGHSFKTSSRLLNDFKPLLIWEEASLVAIDTDSDNHLIKHGERSLQDIKMSCRKWIERSWKQSFFSHIVYVFFSTTIASRWLCGLLQ